MKKSNLKLKVKYLKKMDKKLVSKIFQLKKSHYKFSFSSQKIWFKKNIQNLDKHLILYNKKDVIGYNVLRYKKINFIYQKSKISSNAYIFDTIIIKNEFRNLGFSKLIMNKSNNSGKVVIEYQNLEQLDKIIDTIKNNY